MSKPTPEARAAALKEVQAAVRANDLTGATVKALAALDAGVEHPMLLNLRALKAEEEGRALDALPDLQRARELAPTDFTVANALGLCLARLERYGEALAAFEAAIRLEPRFAPAHHNKGWVSDMMGDLATARASHELALKMNPDFVEASASLAMMAVRAGDMETARAMAERILQKERNQPTAQVALAAAEVAAGQFAVAETRLRLLLSGPTRRILPQVLVTARGLWADALDGLNRPAEAFAAYGAEKAEIEALHGARFRGDGAPEGPMTLVARMRDYFSAAEPWSPTIGGEPSPARRHVFVAGLPGSGVEAMGRALAANGEGKPLFEQDTLSEAAHIFMGGSDGLDRLAKASGEALAVQRDIYWKRLRAFGIDSDAAAVIDASTLNLLRLPLIARLFPAASVLLAWRDPRDVAIEALRRHHPRLSPLGYQLLTPQGAAEFQAAALDLVDLYRRKLPLTLNIVRYEDMAADPTGEAARLAAVTGVTAVAPPTIAGDQTPGQWRRYAAQLAPILPILRPWIERLGYPPA